MVEQVNHVKQKVTVALLGQKLDSLIEKLDERYTVTMGLWAKHDRLHEDQEKRLRFLEERCHEEAPIDDRVTSLELWREAMKVQTGTMAKISVGISTGIVVLAEVYHYLRGRFLP